MPQEYKINSTLIKRPDRFKIERYNLTDLARLASGLMCGDLIAKKRKFFFEYDAISSTDLNTIMNAIWSTNKLFYVLTYIENGTTKTANVYVGSIPMELARTGSKWIWKNVNFNLIEQ